MSRVKLGVSAKELGSVTNNLVVGFMLSCILFGQRNFLSRSFLFSLVDFGFKYLTKLLDFAAFDVTILTFTGSVENCLIYSASFLTCKNL